MDTANGGHGSVVHDVFVPGRLCVIGEHTDWAAGYRDRNRSIPPGITLVATTQEGLHARVRERTDGRLVFKACSPLGRSTGGNGAAAAPAAAPATAPTTPALDVAMTEEALEGVIQGKGFYMYVAGTALVVCSRFGLFASSSPSGSSRSPNGGGGGGGHGHGEGGGASGGGGGGCVTSGVDGVTVDNYLTTLPMKKGLSSSAAVCVLVVRALCLAYGLELSIPQVMELAHLGEARAGSKCGRMDQCCALGRNHVAAMFFDGEDVQIYEVAPPECGIFLVVADLNGSKDTVKMLACLNECFPHPKDSTQEKVHQYVRDNTARAWKAVEAIEQGDAQGLGRVMAAAQESFDKCAIPICPSEFSSPLLHAVMSDERVKGLTWGIKGVGAQGDGSVQLLARGREEQTELTRVLKEMGMSCVLPVTVIRSEGSACGGATSGLSAADGNGGPVVGASGDAPTKGPRKGALPLSNGDVVGGGEGCVFGRGTASPLPLPPPPSSSSSSASSCSLISPPLPLLPSPPRMPPPPPPLLLHPRRVRSAVIVAAGLSTRMFPASAVVKKELFPVVDHDGVCKPVILAIMEGLVESGIERFVVVVQEKDIPVFDGFFSLEAVKAHKHRLKPAQRAYCARIEALRPRITYAVQERQEGFGHAVYCARHAFGVGRVHNGNGRASGGADKPAENGTGGAGGEEGGDAEQQCEASSSSSSSSSSGDDEESFLLVLGDHLYRRGVGTTHACADQLVHSFLAHGEAGKPAIGLKVMRESSVSPYGVAAGECVAHPPTHTLDRWERAAAAAAASTSSPLAAENGAAGVTPANKEAVVEAGADTAAAAAAAAPRAKLLGGRVYRLTKLVEKPAAEFARENLVTPGLGTTTAEGGGVEGRHLVVFGQYILPARRTFDILAEDISLDRRERGEFQLTSVLDRMRREDGGMLGCVIHGDALDMGIPGPYVATMSSFAEPHRV